MRNAQHGRSSAAQVVRDPVRLDEEIGEAMDRGKLRIWVRQDGDLRSSTARRLCQFRLEECQFRQFASSAMERSVTRLLGLGIETAGMIDVLLATKGGVEVFLMDLGNGAA